jgi:hypothetical protein
MARVYRAYDERTGQDVALKQWCASAKLLEPAARRQSIAQFEYEYRTLAQLSHPCMIEVYDFGLSEIGPYFTMELLDGGDLRERAPLPWPTACRFFYDLCSSLALLHSRRLIHRDVSPRNVRCTRRGGAKLIDFGAMRPMGLCQQVVGTPAFAAPEVVQGVPLDGRVDLYSLGATLYFALTGQQPSAARDFSDVLELTQTKPPPPSRLVPEIPLALDTLVLSLLDPNPALRPRSAFDVMQRLAAIGQLEGREPLSVAQAYLVTPELTARDAILARVRERCARATAGRGGTLRIEGPGGIGRSRVLDVSTLWAKTLGCTVLRCRSGTVSNLDGSLARALTEQLVETVSLSTVRELREQHSDFDALFEQEPAHENHENTAVLSQARKPMRLRSLLRTSGLNTGRIQATVARCVLAASQHTPLLIAVDDVHASDLLSSSLLTDLALEAPKHRMLLLLTQDTDAALSDEHAPWVHAQHILGDSERLLLAPLSGADTHQLLCSVFGDVPNLALLSDRVFSVSAGNPGATIEIAQWLIDRGVIRYEGGIWALPNVLALADLPVCATDTLRTRIERLSPLARELASAQALLLRDGLSPACYRAMAPDSPVEAVDAAVAELLGQRIVELEHGTHTLAQRATGKILRDAADETALRERHRALARYCSSTSQPALHTVHHLLAAGESADALEQLLDVLRDLGDNFDFDVLARLQTSPEHIAAILLRALEAGCALRVSAQHEHLLRRWLTMASVLTRDEYYFAAAPAWREQLERDSGLTLLGAAPSSDPDRVAAALQCANDQYTRTPEAERVYSPLEALRQLTNYVGCSLAVAARRLDAELTDTLPRLLEPFAPFAPELHALWQIALGAQQSMCRCQVEQARARWLDVYKRLEELPEAFLHQRTLIRGAVAYAIGVSEASLGMQSALRWANELDGDPLQAVNAMYLRRIVRLQLGDFEGAEHFRHKAELLAAHADTAQMFTSTIVLELVVHALAGDLLGIKQLADRIAPIADRSATWEPYRALADAYFERLRGNASAAVACFERCLALCTPGNTGHLTYAWPLASAGLTETFLDLGQHERAARLARSGLASCRKGGVLGMSHMVVRTLALAEAKLGNHAYAVELLDAVIDTERARAVTGLHLGSLYEARAFVAIEAGDNVAVGRYARLAAREYRYRYGSSLGARCERLLEAAALREPSSAQPAWGNSLQAHGKSDHAQQVSTEVSRVMAGAEHAEGRALRALRLLCEDQGASAGHLFLSEERSLRVAASYGADAPEPLLLELAHERLRSDLRQRENVTRVRGDTAQRFEPDSRTLWTDRHGRAFESRVLHCVQHGKPRCAGILLLAYPPAPPTTRRSAQFASAVSAYLIDAGETSGL